MAVLTEVDDRWVDVGGLRTRYWDVGSGPPLVLLHGIGAHAGFWRAAMPGLAGDFRLLVPDVCGFGRSERPDEVSRATLGGWLAGFITALDVGPCAAVGNSMGGGVLLAAALDHPDRFTRIGLCDSASLGRNVMLGLRLLSVPLVGELLLRRGEDAVRRMLVMLAPGSEWIWEGLIEETDELGSLPGAREYFFQVLRWGVGLFVGMRDEALAFDELGALRLPVQVIWGRDDPLFPLKDAVAAAALISDVRLDIVENCGHMPHMERPEEFNRLVTEFLLADESAGGAG